MTDILNFHVIRIQLKRSLFFTFFVAIIFGSDKDSGEKVEFNSANPFSFYHIITDLENQPPQKAYGILRMPVIDIDGPVPLIIRVNGRKNWADNHHENMTMNS